MNLDPSVQISLIVAFTVLVLAFVFRDRIVELVFGREGAKFKMSKKEDVKPIQEARIKEMEEDSNKDAGLGLQEKPATEATVQKADVYSLKSIPEWHRKEIEEWLQPIAGFKPIPFGESLARKVQYPDIVVPFQKPRFGRDRIPFELNIQETDRFIKGVEHAPRHPTDTERSQEITPGARNVTAAYALVTSGNARRIAENVEFEGLRIGYLEFYLEDEAPFTIELVLGKNIRDWSYKHPDVVQVVIDRSVEQVWRDSKDEATIDMLKIVFPNAPCNIKYCQVCVQIEGVPASYKHTYPSIRLSGLTYRVAYA